MKSNELRQKYIDFFVKNNHSKIESSSLIPEYDSNVLFTTAGMHPLIPYLLGKSHPSGNRLTDVQKCLRTNDIEEVGDKSHLTFFEMLGNWSLGDYFKKESIEMSFNFLTKELGIPTDKIFVTCFIGDDLVPRDNKSANIWYSLGINPEHIYFYGKDENWWEPTGDFGPCGPDTEIFFDTGKDSCGSHCGPSCSCGKYLEIWNNVFMTYQKTSDGQYQELKQKNVDTGMGLERVLTILNNKNSVYETDLFVDIIQKIEELSNKKYDKTTERDFRIIADHMRAAVFILGDDKRIKPSNKGQGYVLRRLIRRTSREFKKLNIDESKMTDIAKTVVEKYKDVYGELKRNEEFILSEIEREQKLFSKSLNKGLKVAEKAFSMIGDNPIVDGTITFKLYDTFGFPVELTQELAKEKGKTVDLEDFQNKFREHQEKSRGREF